MLDTPLVGYCRGPTFKTFLGRLPRRLWTLDKLGGSVRRRAIVVPRIVAHVTGVALSHSALEPSTRMPITCAVSSHSGRCSVAPCGESFGRG